MIDSICALSTVRVGSERKIWILQPFQEYFTHIEPTVHQRWAKTGVFEEKTPDLPVENLAYHMCL